MRRVVSAVAVAVVAALASACGSGLVGQAVAPTASPAPTPQSVAGRLSVPKVAFGPFYGSGCPAFGACGCGQAKNLADEFNCQLDHLSANDIPIASYLFDGNAWSKADSSKTGSCAGPDCCSWNLGNQVFERLNGGDVRALLHFWGGCHSQEQYQRAYTALGSTLLGFYLDDGSSDAEAQGAISFMQSVAPGNSACILKAYQNRTPSTSAEALQVANVCYVGDLPYNFQGLRTGVERVLGEQSLVPAPFNELTGYAFVDNGAPDEETYCRRLHFGCFQPVMAHTPYANMDPWRPQYSQRLVKIYRYYAWLHKELVPYFYSYSCGMLDASADPAATVLRGGPETYSFRVGNELFVAVVTTPTDTLSIQLPEGQWINYWDESSVLSGTLSSYPVPLGREPIFIRYPAILPMDVQRDYTGHGTAESHGSLTVLVYPQGSASFKYRDDLSDSWITISASLAGDQLTLDMQPSQPAIPVLYRIGRWPQAPRSVAIGAGIVTVNGDGTVPAVATEKEVNGSASDAWFYDAAARRLIVKAFPH